MPRSRRVPRRAAACIGTCLNPHDGRSYFLIAYRDCCGKSICDIGKECWCFGEGSMVYHCSTAVLLGEAH